MEQNWNQIKSLVASALELAPGDRSAYLDRTCAPELRGEVESLLDNSDQTGDFIERPALDVHRGMDLDTDCLIGSAIGAYRIESRIGEGGMGTVYRAVRSDAQYDAQVAIKVLRRGISSKFIIERFRNERQILARLNHPNIGRLLDGGETQDGRPYFVMELIEGKPLDEFCDAARLNTGDRLNLFGRVCAAVQYAHSNLIVHRDLKPTNILVTADGVPKLLDFGIAKILSQDDAGGHPETTMAAVRLMTPEYASPEQVRGETITTQTDVYTLGVILYELLTGHHPFRRKKPSHELERMICDVDPDRPSTAVKWVETVTDRHGVTLVLTPEWVSGARDGRPERLIRRLRGDLDNIVLMAMKKDPQKRYESAGQLAADIRRHLEDQPVIARPDTFGYRWSKFFVRHKAGAAAAAVIVFTMTAAGLFTWREAGIARAERARAERRFNDVRHLATSFLFEFHDAIRSLPGSTPARALVVKKALAYLDSLSREVAGDASLQRELAEAYEKVAEVQGGPADSSLGDTAAATRSLDKALGLRESLAGSGAGLEDRMALAAVYGRKASLQAQTGNLEQARGMFEKAFRLRESIFAEHPSDLKVKRSLAVGYWELGVGFAESGAYAEALKAREKSLAIFDDLRSVNPTRANRRSVALLHKNLSATLNKLNRLDDALGHANKAIVIDEALVKEEPDSVQARRDLGFSYGECGDTLVNMNRPREALDIYRKSLEVRRALAAADPKDQFAQSAVANIEYRIGAALLSTGDLASAIQHHSAALAVREAQANSDEVNVTAQVNVAESLGALADVYARQGRAQLARTTYRRALSILEKQRENGKLAPMYSSLWTRLSKSAALP